MSVSRSNKKAGLFFYCMRQKPESDLIYSIFGSGEVIKIEIPCSGRIGVGEIMLGIAEGYEKVVVLSCGEGACLHQFGCPEAKKAYEKALKLANIAGVDSERMIFIEKNKI